MNSAFKSLSVLFYTATYGQPPSFPPSSQYGAVPGGQTGFQQPDQYMGGNVQPGYNQGFGASQPSRPGGPGMQPGPAMQPPQQKRLDPDQMPSPVSTIFILSILADRSEQTEKC